MLCVHAFCMPAFCVRPCLIKMSTPIKTLVFFDLETTGLPIYEFNRTKITELTMVACTTQHIASKGVTPTTPVKLPRVLHKLSLCFNPYRMIQPIATELTGLDNFQLEHEQPFDANTGELLAHFVEQLPQPVCLVAHNGDRFDFPLLRKELDRVGVQLPDALRCVDSLPLFRKIDALEAAERDHQLEASLREYETAQQELDVDKQQQCAKVEASTEIESTQEIMGDLERIISEECLIDWRKLNETTPQQRPVGQSTVAVGVGLSKRKLFDDPTPTSSPKKRFRLQDVYERTFDTLPPESHCAEADALALLRCVCAMHEAFLALVDIESRLFEDVQPLGK